MSKAKKKVEVAPVAAPVQRSRKTVDTKTNRAELAMKYSQARTARQKLVSSLAGSKE